jgi:hypothetical protein
MNERTYREHSLQEVVTSVYHASEMCPWGMSLIGYDPHAYCDRCDIVYGAFTAHFALPILWSGSSTHYIHLCEPCLSIVMDCEREFQERAVWEQSSHTVA